MTDPARDAAMAQALEALQQRYRASISNTLEAFRTLGARLAEQPDTPEVVDNLRRELHRVRGTAGSYGFAEASRLSAVMEERAVRWAGDARLEATERATILARYVAALRSAFDESAAPALAEPGAVGASRSLLAVDLRADFTDRLREEGRLRGYDVIVHAEGMWSPASLRGTAPHVVVTSVGSAEAVHRALGQSSVPLVILDDGEAPAAARRASRIAGARVLHADDDAAAVFDVVARAAARASWDGATVLVCDDDPDVLALVRLIVEEAGMQVRTLLDPDQLLAELERSRPSLLLLDVNLGRSNGIALTRAVRAVDAFASLPLIVFSSEADARMRQAALDAGADEFVPKPIVGSELRARVTARLDAERLRRLDEGCHPGTGFPLAATFRTVLGAEIARWRTRPPGGSVAIVRAAGVAPGGTALAGWHTEVRRVADAVLARTPGLLVGYADDTALAMVSAGAVEPLVTLLDASARDAPAGAPAWYAGVVGASGVLDGTDAMLSAAVDAAGVAELDGQRVHVWSANDARLAPDVIVVEDDVALADMLRYALDTQGYTHRAYTTGTEALDALRALRPRVGRKPLVLLDVDLPGLDGHSLHERLRVERPGVFAVVFATAHASEGEQLRALRGGAIDYLVKPVSLRVLMAKLSNWMAMTGAMRA